MTCLLAVALAWLGLVLPAQASPGGRLLTPASRNPARSSGLRLGPAGPPIAKPAPTTPPPASTTGDDEDDAPGNDPEVRVVDREELRQGERRESLLLRKRNVPPFWINQEFDTHTTKALSFPPLFLHRQPKANAQGVVEAPEKLLHLDASLTFGWYDRRKSKRRWMNPAVLFFGAFDEHQSSWAAVPLLMGYKRIGEKYNFGQFPLVWAWGNRASKNLLVVPFHFQNKTPGSFQGVSSLLFWYGHKNRDDADPSNDRKHFIAFPLYWDLTRGPKRTRVSPIFFGGRNEETGFKHRTLLPFAHWQSRENGNHREFWSALWIRRTDGYRGMSDWALPPLLTFSTKHGPRKVASFTPLLWRVSNAQRRSKAWQVGPVGWYRDDRQRAQWMAPLYLHFSDDERGAKAGLLLPFAAWQKNPEQSRVHTLLGYGRKSTDGWGFGVHPLLTYMGKRGPKAHVVVGGGMWWQRVNADTGRNDWGVGPLAYRLRSPEAQHFGIPALLTFTGKKEQKRYQVFTPLLVHAKNDDPAHKHNSWIAGPAYFSRRSQGVAAGLAPVFMFQSGPEGYGVIPPALLWWKQDHARGRFRFVSLPAVYDQDPTGRTVGVLGVAWDSKHKVAGEMQRDSVLFPLYYRRERGEKKWWISPVGGGGQGPRGGGWAAGPVFGWKNTAEARRGWGVMPLLFHTKREDGATTVLPGLFLRDRRPEKDLDMWTPLIWRSEVRGDKARKGFAFVPLYFRQRQPGGYDIDAGLGFFWGRNRTRQTHTLIAGPFFHQLSRKKLHTGVFPFSWWMDSEDKRRLIALPLIVHNEDKKSGAHTTLALPLWVDRQLANGRRTWMAFPFVFGRKLRYDFTRASVVPPGYFDVFRLRRNTRFTGVVPLLFRYQKCGFQVGDQEGCRYTLWGSFPLFFYGKDGLGRRTHSALGLYWADRDPGGRKFYTLLGGYQYRPNERTRWYAGPIYRDVTKTHATTAAFPLFFHRRHRTLTRSTTLVAPPLFIGQRRDDRRWFEAGLMVWQFRTPAKVTTVVAPPIFGLQHVYKERRLTWLAPLFLDDNNYGNDERWFTAPPVLYVQHKKGARRQVVQFPLVWHFASKDRHTTIGGLLWWDFRRPGRRTQVVPGLYVGRKKGESKLHVIGPALGWWRTTPTGRHWSALLGLFGGGYEGEQRYMHIFGAKIPLKGEPRKPKAKVEGEGKAKGKAKRKAKAEAKAEAKAARKAERKAARKHGRAASPAI